MSFVFAPAQDVETRVFVKVPTSNPDEYDEVVFFAKFKRALLSDLLEDYYIADYPSELQEEAGDKKITMFSDLAKSHIKGWSEIQTSGGKPMKFTKANVEKVFADPIAATALTMAFGKVVRGVNLTEKLVKNSEAPALTG